jgi:lipid II:glycine glycyltransferase (peptidoglycan interpeptide bridge formation enzyme)
MDRLNWNKRVKEFAPRSGAFLQSFEWGEFQASIGRRVERILVEDSRGVMLAQAVLLDLPLGQSYWQVSKGPLGNMPMPAMIRELAERLPVGSFVRVEPELAPKKTWKVKDVQPSVTSILDLTVGKEAIAAGMKPKTRYNIRLADKKGVTVRATAEPVIEDLDRLLEQTAVRDRFSLHPLLYYARMLEVMKGGEAVASLAFADYDGRPLAANVTIDFNGQRTYLHGASSNLHRNVMAPYALHQYLIDEAIDAGMTSYDFWGVAPVGASKKHSWAGITQFKLGFGGEIVVAPGTFDVPTNMIVYSLYRGSKLVQKMIKLMKRG